MNLVTEHEVKNNPTCLIIMPLLDVSPYESGHFHRVYEYILKVACIKAGFSPELSEDTRNQQTMMVGSLRKVASADMVIFDLTTKDPTVLYQLGVRQALEKPFIIVKDSLTSRSFDINGVLEIEYKENLRVDNVNRVVGSIVECLQQMYASTYSLMDQLGVQRQKTAEISAVRTELDELLNAIHTVKDRLSETELETTPAHTETTSVATSIKKKPRKEDSWEDESGTVFQVGDIVTHPKFGLGIIMEIEPEGKLSVKFHTIGIKTLIGEVEKLQLL